MGFQNHFRFRFFPPPSPFEERNVRELLSNTVFSSLYCSAIGLKANIKRAINHHRLFPAGRKLLASPAPSKSCWRNRSKELCFISHIFTTESRLQIAEHKRGTVSLPNNMYIDINCLDIVLHSVWSEGVD